MATVYWVGTGGVSNWDDNIAGVTPWATTSGGSDNAANPVNGDTVIFDSNSQTMVNGPASTIFLASLNMASGSGRSTVPLSAAQTVNINITNAVILASTTTWGGRCADGSTAAFYDSSTSDSTAVWGNCTINFNESSVNNSTGFGAGSVVVFDGSSINSAVLTFTGTLTFRGSSFNNGTLTLTGTLTIQTGSTNSGTTVVTGSVALTGGQNTVSTTASTSITISGTSVNTGSLVAPSISVTNTLTGTGTLVGAVTVSTGATNYNAVTGNCTLVGTAINKGAVSGTLTVPYRTGSGGWGSWGTLVITGMPGGINGTGILSMP